MLEKFFNFSPVFIDSHMYIHQFPMIADILIKILKSRYQSYPPWVRNSFINIKYNHSPIIKKKGSAIFLHLANKKYKPTKGCIAISKLDFMKILPLISKRTKISIV